jgi:outer membrane lipoprotein carrier protein
MARFNTWPFILLLFAPAAAGVGPNQAPDAGAVDDQAAQWIETLRACHESVFSIQADFVQERFDKLNSEGEEMEGIVLVRRGGLVRLDYQKPERRVIVSDGVTLWAFDKAERTAVRDDVKNSLLTRVFGFVLGEGEDAFLVRRLGGADKPGQGPVVLELVPRAEDAFVESVALSLDCPCPCVKRVLVVDRTGAVIRVTLSNVRTNVKVGKGRFKFAPPRGVKIIQL